jgi:hypothetical protein
MLHGQVNLIGGDLSSEECFCTHVKHVIVGDAGPDEDGETSLSEQQP